MVGVGVITSGAGAFAQDVSEDACPRAALRQMMSVAAKHDAIADVAALELEVLRLCVERQELIGDIVDGNERLAAYRAGAPREGLGPAPAPLMEARAVELPPPAKAVAESPVVEELGAEQWEERELGPLPAPPAPARRPGLRWRTVYGSAGEWVAGVSDGEEVWYVRAGDVLPSGVGVVSVRVRPPGVTVSRDGEQWQIPGPAGELR